MILCCPFIAICISSIKHKKYYSDPKNTILNSKNKQQLGVAENGKNLTKKCSLLVQKNRNMHKVHVVRAKELGKVPCDWTIKI